MALLDTRLSAVPIIAAWCHSEFWKTHCCAMCLCRPLSKTVRFNVLKVIPAGSKSGAVKKAFTAAW